MSESVHDEMIGLVRSNGMSPSALTNISIDVDGSLIGNFANGTSRKLYKIPLATYENVDGLSVMGDNALKASAKSGEMQIVGAGKSGTGEIASGNIESSNVEQAEQLTKLITNKQFYNMNTKSWQTGNAIIDYLLSATN
jgi:flagellar hook protein FlgE